MVAEPHRRRHCALAAIGLAAGVASCLATGAAAGVTGAAAVVSDYRFRGVSLSDRQPVIEASVEASTGAWFAGIEAISASHRRGRTHAGRTAEVDVAAGWTRSFGLVTPTLGVIAFVRPGSAVPANGEIFATLAGAIGPATLTVGGNYAPPQADARGGNLYLFTKAAVGVPATPLTVHAGIGREAGGFAGGQAKVDWSGGVEARVLHFVTLGIDYLGNDQPRGPIGAVRRRQNGGVVVRAGVRF